MPTGYSFLAKMVHDLLIIVIILAHILFDDALEFNEDEERVPNSFVVTLCEVMDMAASSVHETAVSNPPPTRIPTPYGGQLKWTLPGGTILTAHLKDKDKIRHKKRWSQVRLVVLFIYSVGDNWRKILFTKIIHRSYLTHLTVESERKLLENGT